MDYLESLHFVPHDLRAVLADPSFCAIPDLVFQAHRAYLDLWRREQQAARHHAYFDFVEFCVRNGLPTSAEQSFQDGHWADPPSRELKTRARRNSITIDGIPLTQWARENGISYRAALWRLKSGWTVDQIKGTACQSYEAGKAARDQAMAAHKARKVE